MARKILFADDDFFFRNMISTYFKIHSAKFQITVASSGAEAVFALTSQTFDAAILDFHLPDLCADEIITIFRSKYTTIPFIIVTGDERLETEQCVRSCKADYFFIKPIFVQDLKSVLEQLLEKQGRLHFANLNDSSTDVNV